MKALIYLIYFSIIAYSSLTSAETIEHQHGNRSHIHKLPNKGLNHSHGELPIGSLKKNEHIIAGADNDKTHIVGREKPYTVKSLNEIKGKDRKIPVKFSCGNEIFFPEQIQVSSDLVIIWKKKECITHSDINMVGKQVVNSLMAKNNWSLAYAMDIGREVMPLLLRNSAFVALAMTVKKHKKHKKLYEEFIHKMAWENIVSANSFLHKKLSMNETDEMQVDVDTITAILNLR